ncbi:MAG: NADH-quinone oxidoreductase subunit E [Cereibacter sphaeroides]|uniref:NADH-quinone oxidoreductase subunit E n=1 Tax=Cereibacter sphaeroides TaxID=1063 RepID=A0A2W5SHK5_CERSP|nr:MAG: NADH-quinone oxidoreductase subunit E [Cereibacter sphaeroides]
MLRRLHKEQPASFAFTPANLEWAKGQMTKYPEGRQASAIIPILWRAQEQEGWLTRPAIEYCANLLGLAYIRALEVATFYFMFHLAPVGSVAHIQICGTTSCMICGAEDLIAVCKSRIASQSHTVSADGKFSWEEVECLGACTNAPMAQIGKDYYEDLTPEILGSMIDRFSNGEVPTPGPQNGRYASEPLSGLTSLKDFESGRTQYNASAQAAVDLHDTVKRIDGTEVPLRMPWQGRAAPATPAKAEPKEPKPGAGRAADASGVTVQEAPAQSTGKPRAKGRSTGGTAAGEPGAPLAKAIEAAKNSATGVKPKTLAKPRGEKADDLKEIEGIGPKLEALCYSLGFYHFDQIANWTADEIAWVDANLTGFKGRVTRDKWVAQAKLIVTEGLEEFRRRAKTNDY